MPRDVVSPLEGEPLAREITLVGGAPAFEVTIAELTPERKKALDDFQSLAVMATAGPLALLGLTAMNQTAGVGLLICGTAAMLGFAVSKGVAGAMKVRTRLIISADRFSFQAKGGWRHFDRRVRHRLRWSLHDKAREEKDEHVFEERKDSIKRRAKKRERLYQDSYHIVYEQLGQRYDIAAVYGQLEAQRVLAKLKALDELADNLGRKGGGAPLQPDDEWGDQPGDIPFGR